MRVSCLALFLPVVILLVFMLPLIGCETASSKEGSWHPDTSQTQPLKIVYFWSTSGDENQYSSTQTGVRAAQASDEFKELESQNVVKLIPMNDPDNQHEAIEIAQEIRRKPDTLAVIGHTRSGTTLATLPLYAEAAIPVLVPTATSPYILYRHKFDQVPEIDVSKPDRSAPRYSNAFRLPPSDVPDQVHAIKLAIRKLKSDVPLHDGLRAKVMLVCDVTAHYRADVYTKPMCDSLSADANGETEYKIASSRKIDLDSGDIWGLITELHAVDPDFVVLIGYQELARDILQELTERSSTSKKLVSRYRFIMTEDCLHDEILKFFTNPKNLYVTSPVAPTKQDSRAKSNTTVSKVSDTGTLERDVQRRRCDGMKEKIGKMRTEQGVLHVENTDEGYAYDSVLILTSALKKCQEMHSLNRGCVLDYLKENQQKLQGACETYHLDDGERQNAFYYVYSINTSNASTRRFTPKWEARQEDSQLSPVPE